MALAVRWRELRFFTHSFSLARFPHPELPRMGRYGPSVETSYGWVIVFASLALHSISLGTPVILFVSLKPIAADLETVRAVPSFAYSLLMIGAGVGGVGMGWWMDKRGIMQPVLFGTVMICIGALLAATAEGQWTLYVASGLFLDCSARPR